MFIKLKNILKNKIKMLLTLAAVFVVMVFTGKGLPLPWQFVTTVRDANFDYFSENGSIIIDDSGYRVLFLDENDSIIHSETIGMMETYKNYMSVIYLNDYYYVHLIERYKNSELVKQEEVLIFDKTGKNLGTVLTFDHEQLKNNSQGSLINLTTYKGKAAVIRFDADDNTISLISLPLPGEPAVTSLINEQTKTTILPDNKIYFLGSFDSENEYVYAIDCCNDIYKSKLGTDNYEKIKSNGSPSIYIGAQFLDGEFTVFDSCRSEGSKYPYCIKLIIQSVSLWISILYLVFAVFSFAIKKIRSLSYDESHSLRYKNLLVLLFGFIIILFFYSRELYHNAISTQQTNLSVLTESVAYQLLDSDIEIDVDENHNILVSDEDLSKIHDVLSANQRIASENDINIYYHLTAFKDGIGYSVVDSKIDMVKGVEISNISGVVLTDDQNDVFGEITTLLGSHSFFRKYIKTLDNGTKIFIYSICSTLLLQTDSLYDILLLTVKLLSAIVSIMYILTEVKSWCKGIKDRNELKNNGCDCLGVSIVRPINFLTSAVVFCDYAISSLIAKDLLAKTPYAGNTILYALPVTLLSAGYLLGSLFAIRVLNRLDSKKFIIFNCFIMLASMLISGVSIIFGNYLFWIICFLIKGFGSYSMNVYIECLVTSSDSPELRTEMSSGKASSDVSSYALSTIASGYLAEYFGTYAIYSIGLICVVGTFVMAFVVFGKNNTPVLKISSCTPCTNESSHTKAAFFQEEAKFLIKPTMIMLIIFALIPLSLLAKYESLVFPIIMDNAALTKSDIANILVFVQAAVFFVIPMFNNTVTNTDHTKLLAINNLIVAACFILILINPNIVLIVLVLTVSKLAYGLNEIKIREYRLDESKRLNVSEQTAITAALTGRQLIETVFSPIVGFLVALGSNVFFAVSGVIMTIGGILFPILKFKKKR